MKQPGEELQEIPMELNDRVIVGYLVRNPEFFIRNACTVEVIRMPHPVRGTVSLVEWHMIHACNRIHALEENIALSMEQIIVNEGLSYRLLYLQRSLTTVSNFDNMLARFHRWTRDLGLAGASLRLFPDRRHSGASPNCTHLAPSYQSFKPLRIQRLGQEQRYPGPLNGSELLVALPEAKATGSVAMSMLGSDADLGVALFTNRDTSYCQQGQGTQLLHEVALILPGLLVRWVECV